MKSTLRHFPVIAGAIVGFLMLAPVGWNLASVPETFKNGTDRLDSKNRRAYRETRRPKTTGPASLAAKRLDSIRAVGTQEGRLSATLELADSLSATEIAAWLNGGWFTIRGGPEWLLFRNCLLARWRELDPEALLAWSFKNDKSAGQNVLSTWIEKDPQRMVDFFKNHPDEANELRALSSLVKAHPALALQRLQEMAAAGISVGGVQNSFELFRQLAGKSSAALEATLDSLPPELRNQAESALSGQRLVTSFSTEIRALWERRDGWNIFRENITDELRGKVLDELANMPPSWRASLAENYYNFIDKKNATKWLDADLVGAGFSTAQVRRLRISALRSMPSENPDEILKRMGELNLSVNDRNNVISRMIGSLASKPEKAMSLIARLPNEEDRKQAQLVMDAHQSRQTVNKPLDPAEWLEKVSGLDAKSSEKAYQYFSSMEQWDTNKIAVLNQQFGAMPKEKKQQTAQVIVTSGGNVSSVSTLMGEAVRYLVVNPVANPEGQNSSDTDPVRISSIYASRLAIKDPAAATEWVGNLPAGDSKLWAQKNVAKNWAALDPKAAAQWVASLPMEARNEVKTFMKKE